MGDMMRLQAAEEQRLEKLRQQFGNATLAKDPTVYKDWNTVYPLYFDAKVSINDGRRVPRKTSIWWPQANQIAVACRSLGLPNVLEPDKCHPADWENPGRVKVRFFRDGQYFNPIVKNRTQLYRHLADQLCQQNPKLVFSAVSHKTKTASKAQPKKGKTKAQGQATTIRGASRPPLVPHPIPPLDARLPLHSPLVPTGVAVSAVKRDLENEKEAKKKGISMGAGAEGEKEKMPKMKRVVVRGKR